MPRTSGLAVAELFVAGSYHARWVNSQPGDVLSANLAADDGQVAELLHELVQSGVGMRSFHEKEPTLEDVFMRVTKGLVI